MTMHDEIERKLRQAFAVGPSEDGLRWLDQRVSAAMALPAPTRRRGMGGLRMLLRPLVLVAAFVLLTGTVVGAATLLERTVGSDAAWRTAWDRGEVLGIKQTDAGLTLTIERAYADLNRAWFGFTIDGLEAAPMTSQGAPAPIEWVAELRDPTGRPAEEWAAIRSAHGLEETGLSAFVESWEGAVAPVAGTWELTITSVGYRSGAFVPGQCDVGATDPECVTPAPSAMVAGTWRFEFELPAPTGTVVSPRVSDTAGQATVTLNQLRVSPTMVTGRIALRVSGDSVAYWDPMLSIRRGDSSFTSNSSYHVTRDAREQGPSGDENVFQTTAGSDVATGTWQIEIPELEYWRPGAEADEAVHLEGPWTLVVTVP